jgi:multiple sugar transport system permease protein
VHQLAAGDRWAYLFVVPSLLLTAAVVIYPIASGFVMSLHEVRLNRPDLGNAFIGLRHYIDFLSDPIVRRAAVNSLIWVVIGGGLQFVVGLIAALLLNLRFRGVWAVRLLVMLPLFLPSVVASHMWALLLDARVGLVNDALLKLGIVHAPLALLADPATALPAVIVVELWREYAWFALFLLAGLQAIPGELYEAASVDGANSFSRLRFITIPLLLPVIVATTILQAISLANNPDVLVVLTGGGPGNATQVLSLYAFSTAYRGFDFGYASSIAIVLSLSLLAFTVVYVRASGAMKS